MRASDESCPSSRPVELNCGLAAKAASSFCIDETRRLFSLAKVNNCLAVVVGLKPQTCDHKREGRNLHNLFLHLSPRWPAKNSHIPMRFYRLSLSYSYIPTHCFVIHNFDRLT